MEHAQFEDLMTWVGQLWTGWKPTEPQITEWRRLLLPFEYTVAEKAIRQVWQAKNYGKPSPDAVLTQCRLSGSGGQFRGPPDPYAEAGLWIQCVEAPPEYPNRLGWAKPVASNAPDHRLHEIAEQCAEVHAQSYGGRWVVLGEHAWADVQAAQGRLRATPAGAGKDGE